MWLIIFVNLLSLLCPHVEVVVDLVLPKRLVNLWPLFVQFAVVNIFAVINRTHVRVLAHVRNVF